MERFHGFFKRSEFIISMDLKQIDVICIEALQRCLDLVEDSSAGKAVLVLIIFGSLKFGPVVDMASLWSTCQHDSIRLL